MLIFRILAVPAVLVLLTLTGIFKFFTVMSSTLLSIFAGLLFIGGIVFLIQGKTSMGISGFVVGYLISPYGLPKLAMWLANKMEQATHSLQGFVLGK